MELWQKKNNFVIMAYDVIADFIGDEKFGLISQMRRATLSIPANIAEGLRRKSKKELINLHQNYSAHTIHCSLTCQQ